MLYVARKFITQLDEKIPLVPEFLKKNKLASGIGKGHIYERGWGGGEHSQVKKTVGRARGPASWDLVRYRWGLIYIVFGIN